MMREKRMVTAVVRALAASIVATSSLAVHAQLQEISVSGTNTLRFERYDSRGAIGTSPYPFSVDTSYDEFIFNLGWQPTAYDRWRGLIAGVANDSPYRSMDRDLVPERLLLARENGEAAIPYRLEAGDFFAFTSFRTQQRTLKGLSVELQPVSANENLRSSILLFGGAFQNSWRHLQWGDDNTMGLSWLTELADTRINVNLMRNERDTQAIGKRSQQVVSLAAETPFKLGRASMRVEAEVASLRGDHDGATGTPAFDKSDTGSFLQLSGYYPGSTLNWRLRGERYGQDYRPFGAIVTPDRRSAEAHVSWTAPSSLHLRARLQDFRDQNESGNPLDTRVAGFGASGPLAALSATMNLDVFNQTLERNDRSIDQDTFVANLLVSKPVDVWLVQTNLLYQRQKDHVVEGNNPRTKQVGLTVLRPVNAGSWSGSIGPGLVWRDVSGFPFATRDISATLALNLAGGPHRIALSAGRIAQNPALSSSPDVATVNLAFDYRFRTGRHEFGFDLTVFDRKPKPGEKTEAYKAGLTWVFNFDRVAQSPVRTAPTIVSAPTTPLVRDASLIGNIPPGADIESTLKRLADAGIAGGIRQGDATVFETRLLNEVEQRQRFVVVSTAGGVDRAGLIVALNDTGSADEASRVYDRVLRALIEKFGRPTNTFETGSFGASFANDVTTGKLIRIAEWTTSAGTLRLGIPRRLDGLARIEVLHARSFGSPRDTNWGIELLR
jgi:hypothetical protein